MRTKELDLIRVYLAGKAMETLLSLRISQLAGQRVNICELVAEEAVGIADAMMAELKLSTFEVSEK